MNIYSLDIKVRLGTDGLVELMRPAEVIGIYKKNNITGDKADNEDRKALVSRSSLKIAPFCCVGQSAMIVGTFTYIYKYFKELSESLRSLTSVVVSVLVFLDYRAPIKQN